MNLFDTALVDLPHHQNPKPSARIMPRLPLFAEKVLIEERGKLAFTPEEAQIAAARKYAALARDEKFLKQKETEARPDLIEEVLVRFLGYSRMEAGQAFTLRHEQSAQGGAVDVALGRFGTGKDEIIAPFEMKGPTTRDLDALMPGRGKSPVQQAWDYANKLPGSRWVLVSNCVEIRLYGYGRGTLAYHSFDLARLDEEEQQARLWMLLRPQALLVGKTQELLRQTDNALKDITNKLYSEFKGLRAQLVDFLKNQPGAGRLSWPDAIEAGQKILDRILFVAFAQKSGLLPKELLDRATSARNEFNPQPIWDNFRALFNAIDRGSVHLNIPAYNGGLFAPDTRIDAIVLGDPLASALAGLGRWDYGSEVPVNVLGHIFEQSITDIEAEKASASGAATPDVKTGKRKREGVVYTPEMITRFLTGQTLGKTLREKLSTLRLELGCGEEPTEADEKRLLQAYLASMRALTICDPSCGSGAFLISAYELLFAEYRQVFTRLEQLDAAPDFDFVDEILTRNLYGVDLNAESVEISRLSLWLKSARKDHRLQNLEANIKIGNSLIEDAGFTPRPFNWRDAFPQVFAQGGFDIILGNPPYVRQELIKQDKPYLAQHYVVSHGAADLYAYFFERGVKLLKSGGRLGFISSSTFFRTGSGENLRKFLTDGLALESIVDFGDLQVFEGVTTYPAIVTLQRANLAGEISYLKLGTTMPDELEGMFGENAATMPQARLSHDTWRLENDALSALRAKISSGKKTLKQVFGAPLYGIKTGLNEAFVINREKREALVKADANSAKLLKPFLRGENIKRWRVQSEDLWLINIANGFTRAQSPACAAAPDNEDLAWSEFSRGFPALSAHLAAFEEKARIRTDQGQYWWELRSCAYLDKFEQPKIIYPVISQGAKFSSSSDGAFLNDKCFILPDDNASLAYLNSKLCWFWVCGEMSALRGGVWRYEMREQDVSQIPIPNMSAPQAERLSALAQICTREAQSRLELQRGTHATLATLAPDGIKLSEKLKNFHELGFKAFLAEIKARFKQDIPLAKHGEWQAFLRDTSEKITAARRPSAPSNRRSTKLSMPCLN